MPSTTGRERLTYTVQIDAALSRIDVQMCPSGFRIERLNAPSPGAQALLDGGAIVTQAGAVPCPDEGVDLPLTEADECLRYTVNLPEKSSDPTSLRRVGADRLASPDLWLWVPTPRPEGLAMRAHFELPVGVVAAMPWDVEGASTMCLPIGGRPTMMRVPGTGEGNDFRVPETAFAWKSGGAFTHSPLDSLAVTGRELRIASLGGGFGLGNPAVRAWIAQGASTSSLLFGHFPVAQALVIAVPGERSGPGFGMALRGGGPSVVILLDRNATEATLADDWTATHEFLHLGVPRLPPEDSWLFEGLATYYTEVTRARAGIISPAQAYQHLLDGFERGRREAGTLTLRQESALMRERHSFYRVYWAGAAIALLADVAARRASEPPLDVALRSFAECCAASTDDWAADDVLSRLEAYGAPRLRAEARRWLDRREFPALDDALHALGVASGGHGEAVFGRAASAAVRDAIMAAPAVAAVP